MILKKPSVSVILPAYNAEKYITQATSSILTQSHSDLELIVIDDGSTDNTLEILKKIQKKDSRLLIINRENRGLVKSLNEGINVARGMWIARMDADDISTHNRIKAQINYATDNKLDICGSYVKTFGFCRPNIRAYPQSSDACKLQLAFNTCFAHPTIFARANVLKANPYDRNFESIEDYELWTRIACAEFKLGNVPEVLLLYRRTFSQATMKHRDYQDRIRIQIAEMYCRSNANLPELGSVKTILSRNSILTDKEIIDTSFKLLELIAKGKDREHVLKSNLNLFLLHHICELKNTSWKMIKKYCTKKDLFLFYVIRILKLHPNKSIWKTLYLLK